MNTQLQSEVQGKKRGKRGTAILTVVIVTFIATVVAGSLLRLGLHEQQVNEKHFSQLQVRNATESIIELGIAELQKRWKTQASFSSNELSPNVKPLSIPSDFIDLWKDSSTGIDTSSFELVGGIIPESSVRYYIDPDDPANQFDPLRGNETLVREVEIYAKASTVQKDGNVQSAYAVQRFQLRDVSLLAYGIFYNMDLELHPGPQMILNGRVHSNGDIWVVAKTELRFEDVVTTAQSFYVGMMRAPYQTNWSNFSGESDQTGTKVWIRNGKNSGTKLGNYYYLNPYKGSGATNLASSYWDSRTTNFNGTGFTNWREFSSDRWGGYLQTQAHSVHKLNPVGFPDYVPDTKNPDGETLNYGYALIEPNMPAEDPNNPGYVNPYHKGIAEIEKFAYKAGLIVRVHYDDGGTPIPENALPVLSYHDDPNHSSRQETGYYISLHKIARSNAHDYSTVVVNTYELPRKLPNGTVETDEDGNVVLYKVSEVKYEDVEINPAYFNKVFAARPYEEKKLSKGGIEVVSGMQEQREKRNMDLIEINMGNLKEVIEKVDSVDAIWKNKAESATYDPSQDFNGVLYVEFPTDTDPSRTDKIVPAMPTLRGSHGLGLMLSNGTKIPNPDYNKASGRSEGFTLATNHSVYIKGHYNADGNSNTGSSTTSDKQATPDALAAIAADAVTILSNNFSFKDSYKAKANKASFTEISAAIITGITPTNKAGKAVSSGGNNNFVRFLENWSDVTFRYRGSMVALFESEVANAPWNTSYFDPPRREWGYFDRFSQGSYAPGIPYMRSYRRLGFKFISKNEYDSALAALQASNWK